MNKFFKGILCAAVCGAAVLGSAGCGGGDAFAFAGSLQTLYGGENGYPQAVLVAKTKIIEEDEAAIAAIQSYMQGSRDYLASAEPTAVASALAGKYVDAGLNPSFNANNLTAQVIANCSVNYTPASAGWSAITDFLTALHDLNSSFVPEVPDKDFFYEGGAEEGALSKSYQVYAPDGAPALALANAIDKAEGNSFVYHIVAASEIQTVVTGGTLKADFCILPVNMAANLSYVRESYKILGTVTNGNMYLLSTRSDLPAIKTAEDLQLLKGKTVGVVQLANVPGLTFRLALANAQVDYRVLGNDTAADKNAVNLVAVDATQVTLSGECDYYLCPEPAASAKVAASNRK